MACIGTADAISITQSASCSGATPGGTNLLTLTGLSKNTVSGLIANNGLALQGYGIAEDEWVSVYDRATSYVAYDVHSGWHWVDCTHGATLTLSAAGSGLDYIDLEATGLGISVPNGTVPKAPLDTFTGDESQTHSESSAWAGWELVDTLLVNRTQKLIYGGVQWGYVGRCTPEPVTMVMLGCLGVGMAATRRLLRRK